MNALGRAKSLLVVLLLVSTSSAVEAQQLSGVDLSTAVLKGQWGRVTEGARQWQQESGAPTADWLLGHASLATGDYRQATSAFAQLGDGIKSEAILDYASTLVDQNPTNAVAHMLKGDALARAAKYEDALVALDQAVQLDSTSALLFNERGTVNAMAGKTQLAIADFEKATALAPRFAEAHANLGLERLASGDGSDAIRNLTRAIELAPDFALAYNGRGAAYSLVGAWEDAETDFARASILMPSLTYIQGNAQWIARHRAELTLRSNLPNKESDERSGTLMAVTDNLERLSKTVGLLYDLKDKSMPLQLKVPLQFAGPILQDMETARTGHFDPVTSRTLERVFVVELQELTNVVGGMVDNGLLPATYRKLLPVLSGAPDLISGAASQAGRGSWKPTISDVEHYLDGFNKIASASLGMIVAGPRGASLASTGADLAADIVRGATEPYLRDAALDPVRTKVIQDWRASVDAAAAHGVPAVTFSRYTEHIPELKFAPKLIAEYDSQANWFNTATATRQTTERPLDSLRRPTPVSLVPIQQGQDSRARRNDTVITPSQPSPIRSVNIPLPRPDEVSAQSYRLPSNAVPMTKPGGVSMRADVVKNQPADTSAFGGSRGAPTATSAVQQDQMISPFLLFCAPPPPTK